MNASQYEIRQLNLYPTLFLGSPEPLNLKEGLSLRIWADFFFQKQWDGYTEEEYPLLSGFSLDDIAQKPQDFMILPDFSDIQSLISMLRKKQGVYHKSKQFDYIDSINQQIDILNHGDYLYQKGILDDMVEQKLLSVGDFINRAKPFLSQENIDKVRIDWGVPLAIAKDLTLFKHMLKRKMNYGLFSWQNFEQLPESMWFLNLDKDYLDKARFVFSTVLSLIHTHPIYFQHYNVKKLDEFSEFFRKSINLIS